jgi:hypothetical protein
MSYRPNTGGGSGDMLKSVYDTNNNGIVDVAASANAVEWANVSAKPSTFTPSTHTHEISDVTNLQTALNGKAPTITTAQAYATATTSISAATYADITGCSVSLAAGTWLVIGHVVGAAANLIIQGFIALTDSSNNVISESAMTRPASGTASLNAPTSTSVFGIVTPSATTTYKLRAARGLTTHTSTITIYDGTGYNTTNHATTSNSDKGTQILAIKIA